MRVDDDIIQVEDDSTAMEQDSFTLSDRKELIRQGLQLDKIEQDLANLKTLVSSSTLEDRVRKLEDARLVQDTRLNTFLWLATLMGGVTATVIDILLRLFFPWKI